MADSKAETLRGTDGSGKTNDSDSPKPVKLTQSQIDRLMYVSPSELTPYHPVVNAVGTWYMGEDGYEVWFERHSAERLQKIKAVDFSQKRRKLIDRIRDFYSRSGLSD
jgi:hypothetical protein